MKKFNLHKCCYCIDLKECQYLIKHDRPCFVVISNNSYPIKMVASCKYFGMPDFLHQSRTMFIKFIHMIVQSLIVRF